MSKYAQDIVDIKTNVAALLERSTNTLDQLKKLNGTVTSLDKQVDDNCTEITRLKERQTPLAVVGTAISTGISSGIAFVAAWVFGTQK